MERQPKQLTDQQRYMVLGAMLLCRQFAKFPNLKEFSVIEIIEKSTEVSNLIESTPDEKLMEL